MIDNIVPLPERTSPREMILVCGCGNATFRLRGDALAECAACDTVMSEHGHHLWYDIAKRAGVSDSAEHPQETRKGNNDGGEFAKALAKKRADASDWLVCGTYEGTVSAWSSESLGGQDRTDWTARQLNIGLKMLTKGQK